MIETVRRIQKIFFGRPGILSYAPYHEPGYHRGGRRIVDSYRVAEILPELRKADPYRPITVFWAPPHWDANGEPFGFVDGVDYFIVDVYTRDLKKAKDREQLGFSVVCEEDGWEPSGNQQGGILCRNSAPYCRPHGRGKNSIRKNWSGRSVS